jgi:hypothetical protein
MYYVCIENNEIIGIQSYKPEVPLTVEVVEISDDNYQQILKETHTFDILTKEVVPLDNSALLQKEQVKLNNLEQEFLNKTDWKILRHIRQKALNVPTSLTGEEYLKLESLRNQASLRIVK